MKTLLVGSLILMAAYMIQAQKAAIINVKSELTINKPIDEVWEVMGNQFAAVHKWSSNFKDSKAGGPSKFDGIDYSCRETVTDRGITTQVLEAFDPSKYTLSYKITKGAPEIAKKAYSTWSLRQVDLETTLVVLDFSLEPKMPLNEQMQSKIKSGLAKSSMLIAEELKYYLEQNEPHPNNLIQIDLKQ